MIEDGVVPRTQLPHVFRRIAEIGRQHQVRIVNVAHAGDGNVHPILLFDERDPRGGRPGLAAGREILRECIACGGSITAEHGIGVEKLALMEACSRPADLEAMRHVREAFDPLGTAQPRQGPAGRPLGLRRGQGEGTRLHVRFQDGNFLPASPHR